LLFDAEFVGQHLTQVVWLKYQLLMHLFAVVPCCCLPGPHSPLIQTEGSDDSRGWAAKG
jgi:hypothetical protein